MTAYADHRRGLLQEIALARYLEAKMRTTLYWIGRQWIYPQVGPPPPPPQPQADGDDGSLLTLE